MQDVKSVEVGPVPIGPAAPLAVIAGPCVAESWDVCMRVGEAVRDRCAQLGLGYIFKASFDKANRSAIGSFRGPGVDEGLALLKSIGEQLGVPVTTDLHESDQAAAAAEAVDLLQIPAFLCRQTDLLLAAAATGKPVNVKKGQFLSPGEMANVVSKVLEGYAACGWEVGGGPGSGVGAQGPGAEGVEAVAAGSSAAPTADHRPPTSASAAPPLAATKPSPGLILTERGTFFGYHRLVNDFIGVADMMDLGWPVCFDVTHSTQQPGGQGQTSGGRPERAPLLARCAVVAGVQALFLETHPQPAKALSDAATMLPLERALLLLDEAAALHAHLKQGARR